MEIIISKLNRIKSAIELCVYAFSNFYRTAIIKIQIWITLIANLLLMVIQRRLKRPWSFSGLATIVRLTLMYYVDLYSLLNQPEKDWQMLLEDDSGAPPEPSLFD